MIPVLTTVQMRSIDERSMNGSGDIAYSYMQKAGTGVVEALEAMAITPFSGKIAVICGKGNNGGDGYVIARMLVEKGFNVTCFGLSDEHTLRPEARRAFNEYRACNGHYLYVDDSKETEDFCRFVLIIDAILGIGIKGDPQGVYAKIINEIILSAKPVLAVDTPSGLNNDTGALGNPTICADHTVTMGFVKIGQLFYPGRGCVGNLTVKDLGYPFEIVNQYSSTIALPETKDLKSMLPPRKPGGSKFDHGLVLTMCGSRGMAGSATLSAMSALRTGCGMVHCILPHSLLDILSIKLTEPVLHPVAETNLGTLSLEAIEDILRISANMQAVLIGPGISHQPETLELVRTLIARINIPVVLDADGINAFRDHPYALRKHPGPLIVTPHAGEWKRLFGIAPEKPEALCAELAIKAREYDMTIVYKGSPSIAANPQGAIFILPAGNSGMATAGSGDVLAGIIVSLLAQGASASDAAVLGAAIHGFAGDKAAGKRGEYAMIATDIIENLGEALQYFCSK
jgi:NAD(P)H-hydrate epimerase